MDRNLHVPNVQRTRNPTPPVCRLKFYRLIKIIFSKLGKSCQNAQKVLRILNIAGFPMESNVFIYVLDWHYRTRPLNDAHRYEQKTGQGVHCTGQCGAHHDTRIVYKRESEWSCFLVLMPRFKTN